MNALSRAHLVLRHWSRPVRVAVAVAVPVGAGVLLWLLMPRGPMTTLQSMVALVVASIAGAFAGVVLRSRWAALLAPVVAAGTLELTWLGVDGPTVDALRFESIYAWLAMAAGRGFDGLVILFPMAVGAFWGAAVARRGARTSVSARGSRVALVIRRVNLGLASLAVVALVVALLRPASTPPILDAAGTAVPGSIAELVTVPIGGHDQTILLRGTHADAPVLLFLEGGPGGTAIGAMHYAGRALEEHVVVATWDQRGTGKSATAREPVSTLTLDQMVSDTIEVTDYLRERFGQERIYLLGSSWGTTLGVLAVQQRPDLFRAYIGSGQMVDQQETDRLMYADSLAYADRVGDAAFGDRLRAIGAPPYTDMLAYPVALSSNPEWQDFEPGSDSDPRSAYPASLLAPEYTFTEQVRSAAALVDTFAALYPQLQDVDFRVDVPALEVPVYLVEGVHEAPGRAVLAEEWIGTLAAPRKQLVTFASSGHTPHLDEPGRFAHYLAEVVLAETLPG